VKRGGEGENFVGRGKETCGGGTTGSKIGSRTKGEGGGEVEEGAK